MLYSNYNNYPDSIIITSLLKFILWRKLGAVSKKYYIGGFMKKIMAGILLLALLLTACNSEEQTSVSNEDKSDETSVEEAVTNDETDNETSETEEMVEEVTLINVEDIEETVRELADAKDIYVGAAVEPAYLDEPDYVECLTTHFNTITPENRMKWSFIHPEKDVYDFSGGDKIVEFAIANDMHVRGHALVWHIQNPDWLIEGNYNKEELEAILEDHVKTVVGHYKGEVYAWDVVNEMIDNRDFRSTIWYDTLGEEYIEKALIWAREADPDALLYINDYMVEEENLKSNAMYDLCVDLLDKGVPLDGVGFQFHIDPNNPFNMLRVYANIKRFRELGLLVDFTEIDLRIGGTATDAKLESQRDYYYELMELVNNLEGVNNYTTWGLSDKYSWVPDYFSGFGHALPFDETYAPKPAYYGMLEGIYEETKELGYEAKLANLTESRIVLAPLQAAYLEEVPALDGEISDGEWDNANRYTFAYNQLYSLDQIPSKDLNDIYGEWTVGFNGDTLYGMVIRQDDILVDDHATNYMNDCIEVFIEYGTYFNQLRTIIGADFEMNFATAEAVWSEDYSVLEYSIKLPESDLTGLMMGFNIAMSDNDSNEGSREVQLYPITGANNSYKGQDLINIQFEGDTPRPVDKTRISPTFFINEAAEAPVIDGEEGSYEWGPSVGYQFAYNQLGGKDQTLPPNEDLNGTWELMYIEDTLYGQVRIQDDLLVVNPDQPIFGDHVSFDFEVGDAMYNFIMPISGDMVATNNNLSVNSVWSDDNQFVEFVIHFDKAFEKDFIWNFMISLTDYDEELAYKLYPIYGHNESPAEGNLAEVTIN